MTGDVEAGDFFPVAAGEFHDVALGLELGYRQGGVDIDFMGGGDAVQHHLQCIQIRQGLAARKHEVALRGDGVHLPNALADFSYGKARQVGVLLLVDAEGAVVVAVIRDKDGDGCAALARLVGMNHVDRPFVKNQGNRGVKPSEMFIRIRLNILLHYWEEVKGNGKKTIMKKTESRGNSVQNL
ncbi:hypothetical protein SDC9_81193 [bioreactor metagenome]|uniref:Uncharacterized protein n=1 Tax=bioreactor metagenome TaxID=1076179 RepID=A0A644Z1W2_9ZZZZ